jgi:hypothetical protein
MSKLTLNTIGSRYGSIDALNDNFDRIEAEFDNVLSLDGSTPNEMQANLNMGGNQLINVAQGVNNTDGVNLQQVNNIVNAASSGLIASQREVFTATAGQTLITLNNFTYLPGANNIAVYRNGVRMYSGDAYNELTNNTFQFTEPLELGDRIEVISNEAVATSGVLSENVSYTPVSGPSTNVRDRLRSYEAQGGSELIGFEAAGAGATSRTVESKLREFVSVKDFGAVGDGSNERANIQAAIDAVAAAGGGEVLFENKTYTLGARLLWRSGVFLRGAVATILKVTDGVDSPVIGIENQQTTPAITNIGAFGIVFDGNAANSPGVTAPSAVILDPVDGGYFERCAFRNARGYGASLQYLGTGVPDNSRVKNITFIQCDFHNNGIGTATPGTTYDGIDVKNCDGLTFVRCRAYSNTLDGFDFRGDNIDLIACEAYSNGGSGLEISANSNGNTQNTAVRVFGGHYWGNGVGVTIANNPAGGGGLTRVSISGAHIRANTGDGVEFTVSSANTHASISDAMIFNNGGKGVDILGNAEQIALSNCHVVANVSDGVYCNAGLTLQINGGLLERNGGWGYLEGASASRNNLAGALRVAGNTAGQISINSASRLTKVDASVLDYSPNGSAPSDIIASAATITLPEGGQAFFVTGTSTITDITLSHRGRIVTLQFTSTATVTDAGTLRLAGNFVATPDDTLTLMCNGSFWYELSRSVN